MDLCVHFGKPAFIVFISSLYLYSAFLNKHFSIQFNSTSCISAVRSDSNLAEIDGFHRIRQLRINAMIQSVTKQCFNLLGHVLVALFIVYFSFFFFERLGNQR